MTLLCSTLWLHPQTKHFIHQNHEEIPHTITKLQHLEPLQEPAKRSQTLCTYVVNITQSLTVRFCRTIKYSGMTSMCEIYRNRRCSPPCISEVHHCAVINLKFVCPCIIVRSIKKNPTRCNNVSKFYYSIFIWSSTCFGWHITHHQEPKSALAASGFS